MFIKSMKISNFQCFSEVPVDIDFEKDITCLIGNNGAGKTSILKAIQKVFGNTTDERTIFKSDFHVATGETDLQNRQLYIDIVFEFLDKDEVKTLAFFSPVIYESKNKTFQARMRLEALWNEDEYEDDVSSTLFWVLTDEDVDFGDETPLKIKVENHERRQINLIYVPATRNAKSILNIELKRIIKKIERYADISETDRLAGRHVNHMWRLLNELKIPYVTLLDYDLGRYGGGEKRLFEISEKLGLPKTSTKEILEEHSVFFSYPLDFDMLMINAFPDFYKNNGQNDEHDELVKAVLGKKGDETKYVSPNKFFTDEVLRKYRYLFKTKSKVASHYLICDKIKEMGQSDFEQKCPTVLHRLINKACDILKKSQFQ